MRPDTCRRTRIRLCAALAGAALVAAAVPPVGRAGADPVSSCSTSRGVLVVVDFRHFGGSITRGCDATPSTGYDALHAAGFSTDGTHHDGPGFICRINGRPTAAQDPCFNTPPSTAYWSYWHANAGQGGWSYSTRGAQSSFPPPGSIDAWVFGGTSPPTFSPAVARGASAPTPKSTAQPAPKPTVHRSSHARRHAAVTTPRARHRSAPPVTTGPHASTRPTRPTSGPASASSRTRSALSSTAGSSAIAVAGSNAAPSIVDASTTPTAAKQTSSGSLWPVVFGLALAVALAAGAGWTVLRRRRAAS